MGERELRIYFSLIQGQLLRYALTAGVMIAATLINCLGSGSVGADECVENRVAFDGMQPLTYKRVKGTPD